MLDIKKIKENPDAVKAGLRAKEVDCDATVDRILELDAKIRTLKTNTETQTAQKNKLAKENGKLFGMKKKAEKEGKDVSELDATIAANNAQSVQIAEAIEQELAELKTLSDEYRVAMLSLPNLPDPDLIVRTSGEFRLSNFLLWQCAYSELFVTDVLWPDFDRAAFDRALASYARRDRRMGGHA